ncbi:uncharacterized protein LOC134222392 [Armigeres subalbatus]|uniref:uncharacterized protein LOC134222392 n=1 Tax=Armigeres subalbatus TaxID=124917 RepID=UPI002ED1C542
MTRAHPSDAGDNVTTGTADNISGLNGFGEIEGEFDQRHHPISNKIPPLARSVGLDKLKRNLKTIGINAAFKICRIGIKVVLSSKEDYQKTKQHLDNSKAECFTFDIPSEKPFKAVIRGLPIMDIEEIKSDLELRYKLEPLAIFPMTRHNSVMEYRDCLYLVHFRKRTILLDALKVARLIQDVIVSWKGYRGTNNDVTQYMRCLNFGHGTRNCRLRPRHREQTYKSVLNRV